MRILTDIAFISQFKKWYLYNIIRTWYISPFIQIFFVLLVGTLYIYCFVYSYVIRFFICYCGRYYFMLLIMISFYRSCGYIGKCISYIIHLLCNWPPDWTLLVILIFIFSWMSGFQVNNVLRITEKFACTFPIVMNFIFCFVLLDGLEETEHWTVTVMALVPLLTWIPVKLVSTVLWGVVCGVRQTFCIV